ncbi:hypothetical protein [Bradyrhizobium sp. LA2.1]|uniref:hypothetical protein n=1 Tax=Bradyrhizobium sp. LA2.1 TaxID=3156376 RepID=UPI0033975901
MRYVLGLKEDYKRQKRYMPEEIVAKPAVGRTSWSRRAKHVQAIGQIGVGPFVDEEFLEV